MAREELESALRRDGENQARKIWQQVELEAEQLRRQTQDTISRQQQANDARLLNQKAQQVEAACAEAQQQAQQQRLQAETRLAARLLKLAEGLLSELAEVEEGYLFDRLAAEIPAYAWRRLQVHPRDEQRARQRFPETQIITLQEISGGLQVADEDERVVICNTLEKRLSHLWPELLPKLMTELRTRAGAYDAAP